MTVREIQGFVADMYAVEVSPDLISTVTATPILGGLHHEYHLAQDAA